ncbi:MAG: YciI family protein [Streptosporangiaceae bacterium]
MKYLLLFCGSSEDAAAFEALTPDELRARYAQVGAWFAEHKTRIGATGQLQGPQTATSVRFGLDGPPVVTDGPYLEGKESIGGYAEIDVADLDEALRMARTWPGHSRTVEIRPVVTQR